MASWKTVCEIAAGLPGAEASTLHGAPCWRVDGKVFVQLGPRLRIEGEDELMHANGELVMVSTSHDDRQALVHEDSGTFFFTPHYVTSKLVLVWLRRIRKPRLRELLTEAWRLRAPKRLVRESEGF